jgi:cytochrome P450
VRLARNDDGNYRKPVMAKSQYPETQLLRPARPRFTPALYGALADYGKAVQARRKFGEMVSEALQRCRAGDAGGEAPGSPGCVLAVIAAAAAQLGAPESVMSDAVIQDNMTAAFFGNASTGPSLAKALQYLAACPEVLQQLRREQQVRGSFAGCHSRLERCSMGGLPGD